jgi:hypothetical protein
MTFQKHFKQIWEENEKRFIQKLNDETIDSFKRKDNYQKYCKEPCHVLLWCLLSMNSKGGVENAKTWQDKFDEILKLIEPKRLKEKFKNDNDIFVAMNVIIRYFAGGRFLTCGQKYGIKYYSGSEVLTFEQLTEHVLASNGFSLEKYERNNRRADSYKYFEVYREHSFENEAINKSYSNLSLTELEIRHLTNILSNSLGIKNKFARNILMDMRLPNSENLIAIDSRIDNILKPFINGANCFEKKEEFLLQSLQSDELKQIYPSYNLRPKHLNNCSLTAWELDRTLFNFKDDF